jgi:CheY-like chemotaxis protein
MPKHILVVDDESDHAEVVARLLERSGFRVDIASRAREAIRRASEVAFDLIVLDLWMPGIDGVGVARQLGADPRTRDIPILFLTACGSDGARALGFDGDRRAVLDKPFRAAHLIAAVERTLARAEAYAWPG